MASKDNIKRKLELLAPARDCEIGRQAIIHGADAVYIGAEAFGARVAASNTVDDIAGLVDFAHGYNARVYVTVNTLIYEDELRRAEGLIRELYRAGVDALIVQDLGVLRMDIPPIALHASTQCDTRTPEKARFLEACGFSQIVLARELSLDQIREITSSVSVPVEAFVHGALCVSYSGDCQASLFATGRSANRGECAQMCRLPYVLTDASGTRLAPEAHYLSLRDMNRLDRLGELVDAGVSSFKIEGRLKDSGYVRNTVAAYSGALNDVISQSDGDLGRLSAGEVELKFTPDVTRSFNRRFTSYFMDGRPSSSEKMASLDTPKWIGAEIGKVVSSNGKSIRLKSTVELHNGDGLGYFGSDGRYYGFRVNKAEGEVVYPSMPVNVARGTVLYRNRDKHRDDEMARQTAVRVVPVNAWLRRVDDGFIALKLTDDRGVSVEVTCECEVQGARTPQIENRRRTLARLGDTIYRLVSVDDSLGEDSFVPASLLTELRRQAVDALQRARRATYIYDYRRAERDEISSFRDGPLDRHDNVANSLARRFFDEHNIGVAEPAAEVSLPDKSQDRRVMTTRYCLRRELGACLRTQNADKLPRELYLRASGVNYRLDFDCPNCRMKVVLPASES